MSNPQPPSFSEVNRQHWDKAASSYYDAPWKRQMFSRLEEGILRSLEWIGVDWVRKAKGEGKGVGEVRVLDYACGPGTVSRVRSVCFLYALWDEFCAILQILVLRKKSILLLLELGCFLSCSCDRFLLRYCLHTVQ